jgi:hypothetical protein
MSRVDSIRSAAAASATSIEVPPPAATDSSSRNTTPRSLVIALATVAELLNTTSPMRAC